MEEIINLDSDSESYPEKFDNTPKIMLNYFSVTIKTSDYTRLNPEVFLNDNLVDFFLSFFIDKKPSFFAFNSFFFKTFSECGFESVQKWFKSVDLFSKKYWLIPVARMDHWVLIIVTDPKNGLTNKKPLPSILLFDSLDLQNFNPKNEIQSFIEKLWMANTGNERLVDIPIFMLRLPLQDNLWDCGVYLLKYAEIFVADPKLFKKIDKYFDDLFDIKEMKDYRWFLKNTILEFCENCVLNEISRKVVIRIKATPELLKICEDAPRYNLRKKKRQRR